ncbi:hypothetical protein GH5_06998 [Leishmania sp. Ghana 2012 LV757]|uniref:hypothetical protein n=1 Tax=Leishmania sp. Ghana 2012 LV757 TaxID=2803181 RepID=UPI001B46613C|nr:hypothetical protein GH5_06998 [Leishmania sp. Ghana 2012 LV757]
MRTIQLLVFLATLLSISRVTTADVILRPCATTQDMINAMTDENSSHYILFYDSLDVSSVKVYNTLSALKIRRTVYIDILDVREPKTSWLRTAFEVTYAPMLSYIKWLPSGGKVVHAYPSTDFRSAGLAQFLQQY